MSDVSKLNVAGTTYTIKDGVARVDILSLNTEIDNIKTAISDTNASYNSNTETITFTFGVI